MDGFLLLGCDYCPNQVIPRGTSICPVCGRQASGDVGIGQIMIGGAPQKPIKKKLPRPRSLPGFVGWLLGCTD